MEKLSIVIPVHNRARLLRRCLDSVAAQTYRPLQVVVVDNGSTDESARVAVEWGEKVSTPDLEVLVLTEPKPGAAVARHLGAINTDGRVLAFVDSDDTIRPHYARTIMQTFARNPEAELVYWRKMCNFTDGSRRELRFTQKLTLGDHIAHGILNTLGCAMRPELYRRSGGWNANLPQWNDWELGIRYITALRRPAVRINDILVDIFMQKESITGTSFHSRAGRWEISLQAAADHARKLPENQRRSLLRLVAFKTAVLAAIYAREGEKTLGRKTLKAAIGYLPDSHGQLILRTVYFYTSLGLRGAASWAIPLLKAKV